MPKNVKTTRIVRKARSRSALNLPGKVTPVGWVLPKDMSENEWIAYGKKLDQVEMAIQWLRGDWWAYGLARKFGEGEKLAERVGVNYGTIRNYGSVARAFQLSLRNDNLSFDHHRLAMTAPTMPERMRWLERAAKEGWSAKQLSIKIQMYMPTPPSNNVEPDDQTEAYGEDADDALDNEQPQPVDVTPRDDEEAVAAIEAVGAIEAVIEASKCSASSVLVALVKAEEAPSAERIRRAITWLEAVAGGLDNICKEFDGRSAA
jgi:hypothetical protein